MPLSFVLQGFHILNQRIFLLVGQVSAVGVTAIASASLASVESEELISSTCR